MSSIKTDYVLTSEQRSAGYSTEFDGDHIHLYLNGKKVDSFDVEAEMCGVWKGEVEWTLNNYISYFRLSQVSPCQ